MTKYLRNGYPKPQSITIANMTKTIQPNITELLHSRILVVDGAMGTSLQTLDLTPEDFGGLQYEGCNEHLNLTKPQVISEIHKQYLQSGADIIETNTFGATSVVLAEYDLHHLDFEINLAAARIAKEAASQYSTDDKPRFVAGSMGPTTKTISLTGGITYDELASSFKNQAYGLLQGGVDFLLLETSQDTINIKAGVDGIKEAFADLGFQVPIAIQGTIEPMGTLLAGQDIEALYTSLEHLNLLWIGINCATGPSFMSDHIRQLATFSKFPISCIPNAGLPDEDGNYNETPDMFSSAIEGFIDNGWLNVVGGCCGTGPDHIQKLASVVSNKHPRKAVTEVQTRVSGIEALLIDDDSKPIIIGERTNVLGSRRFKRLIAQGLLEEASEIGRRQIRNGAHILDVCLQDPDRDELSDIKHYLELLTKKTKAPIMIDSTDSKVITEALKMLQGKSIINSINLEDGESRFEEIVPLIHQYGASVVVGCIDDDKSQAQAISATRKLEVAKRSYNLLTTKYGMLETDIIFDPLVFPAATGDSNYQGSAAETIKGVQKIKESYPNCKTILGISNVSFGLPPAGREVFNSVFMYHCIQAGLDMAIVNSETIVRYNAIPQSERTLAENIIWDIGEDPVSDFTNHFRDVKPKSTTESRSQMSWDERLSLAIIEGTKEGITDDLDLGLESQAPLEIINGPLMKGMEEVGRQFNANELIVAEVLQSAEAMKHSVSYLEQFMEKSEIINKGTVLLATVKGDVHDIGKNLVDIILSNNGFKVINLGIKVSPPELIEAYREHKPDFIGLSGLLVKSAQMMVATAQDLTLSEIECPILVGGAALSNRFTRLRISPEYSGPVIYCKDAMEGLSYSNKLVDPILFNDLQNQIIEETKLMIEENNSAQASARPAADPVKPAQVSHDFDIPSPPDLLSHQLLDYSLDEIWPYINPQMLFVRHLGYRGRWEAAITNRDPNAMSLLESVDRVKSEILAKHLLTANALFKFFPCNSQGNQILIKNSSGNETIKRLEFGRQSDRDGLCLSDYIRPESDGHTDYIGMFVTSVGPNVIEVSESWKSEGRLLDSHILQVLALETAEGFAELLHQQMRAMWGFADPKDHSFTDLHRANYHGKRYSFGYPACPRLEDQRILFDLLEVESHLNVQLTEEYMMDPEASVSAIVMHHPDAKYFNLSPEDIEKLG